MTQGKREKVIEELSRFREELRTSNSATYASATRVVRRMNLIDNALALLKAQEPVEPKWEKGYVYCGKCGYKLHWIVDLNNFCPNCGQAVKWK